MADFNPLADELDALWRMAVDDRDPAVKVALYGAVVMARLREDRALLRVGALLAAAAIGRIPRATLLIQAAAAIFSRASLAASQIPLISIDEVIASLGAERAYSRHLEAELSALRARVAASAPSCKALGES